MDLKKWNKTAILNHIIVAKIVTFDEKQWRNALPNCPHDRHQRNESVVGPLPEAYIKEIGAVVLPRKKQPRRKSSSKILLWSDYTLV